MAGRGGRGGRGGARGAKANLSFHVSELGFAPGEQLPTGTLQPPPTYPPLHMRRPTPLNATEVDEYLLALSQEFRGSIRDSPFFLKPKVIHKDIVRYTDRYKQKPDEQSTKWEPNWQFVPGELKPSSGRNRRTSSKKNVKVNIKAGTKRKYGSSNDATGEKSKEIEKTFEKLSEKEKEVGEEEKNTEEEEIEEYDEEEYEDDNDYNFDYYDDGGDKYGDDDDGEEGPVY